jgi:Tol biopolymer transport system component
VTAVDQATRRTRILVVGLVDGTAEYISPKEEEAYCPQWSPGGAQIAFVSGTGGVRGVDVAARTGPICETSAGSSGDSARPASSRGHRTVGSCISMPRPASTPVEA